MEGLLILLLLLIFLLVTLIVRLTRRNAYLEGRDRGKEELVQIFSKLVTEFKTKNKKPRD